MPTEGDLEFERVKVRELQRLLKEAAAKEMELRATNARLTARLHEQTMQTQETAAQITQAVLDSIERHGGLRGVGIGHPIEQIVGTLLEIYRCEAEELRDKLDGALKRGDDWTEIAADLAARSPDAKQLAVTIFDGWQAASEAAHEQAARHQDNGVWISEMLNWLVSVIDDAAKSLESPKRCRACGYSTNSDVCPVCRQAGLRPQGAETTCRCPICEELFKPCLCPECIKMCHDRREHRSSTTKPDLGIGDQRGIECGTPEENAQALRDKFCSAETQCGRCGTLYRDTNACPACGHEGFGAASPLSVRINQTMAELRDEQATDSQDSSRSEVDDDV